MADHTTLHVNCLADDKATWLLTARIQGVPFDQWVSQQLNASTIETNPRWARKLSERARVVLLSAGFISKKQIIQAMAEGYDIASLPNAGPRVAEEVAEWAAR